MELTVDVCFSVAEESITEVPSVFPFFSGYFDEQVEADVVKLKVGWLVTRAVDSVIKVIPWFCIAHSYCARFLRHQHAHMSARAYKT